MDINLDIEFKADVQNPINNKYIVTTDEAGYENIIGEGTTVMAALNDFDSKCEAVKKCA